LLVVLVGLGTLRVVGFLVAVVFRGAAFVAVVFTGTGAAGAVVVAVVLLVVLVVLVALVLPPDAPLHATSAKGARASINFLIVPLQLVSPESEL
jgi:hypothetical protein